MNTVDGEKTIGYKLKYKKHPIPLSTRTFYEKVLKSIEENNLPYQMNHVTKGDGDCFYHALYEIFTDIPLLMQRAKEQVAKRRAPSQGTDVEAGVGIGRAMSMMMN